MFQYHKKLLISALILLILSLSCKPNVTPPIPEPDLATATRTILLAITNTPTSTLSPTVTHTPEFVPSRTPTPFLPVGLEKIESRNVDSIEVVSQLPVKEIYELVFSPSGDKMATISERWTDRSKYIQVWDLSTGAPIFSLENVGNPSKLFFSGDEAKLHVFIPYQSIEIYDLTQEVMTGTVDIVADQIAFSDDGRFIASGAYRGTLDESIIMVLEPSTNQEVLTLSNPGMVMHISFSPKADRVVAGFQINNHYRVNIWDTRTGELLKDLIDYETPIFSPDGTEAVTSNRDRIYVFDTASWVIKYSVEVGGTQSTYLLDFSPDGGLLAVRHGYDIVFLDADDGQELFILPDECETTFSPTNYYLVTWCYQSDLKIWGIPSE